MDDHKGGRLEYHRISLLPLSGIAYTGGDLLPEVVERNTQRFGTDGRRFVQLDLTRSPLPTADLLLCRDCLVHLLLEDCAPALGNIRGSAIPWLLTTTFPAERTNREIRTGDWCLLNLTLAPFHFPPPAELLNEGCTEGEGRFADKSLGLWRVADLPLV